MVRFNLPAMEKTLGKIVNNNPFISIILINYNQENFIKSSIKSALNQTYKNFELIIIDNGSFDNSKNIIKKFLKDKRIIFLNYNKNIKVTIRLNRAISIAKGEFVNFLMGDDMLEREKIFNQIKIFQKIPECYGVVYGPSIMLNTLTNKKYFVDVVKINGDALTKQLKFNLKFGHINFNSALIRKECLIKYPMLEDIFIETESFFLSLAIDYKFWYDSKVVCFFREHKNNIGKKIIDNLNGHLKRINELRNLNFKKKICRDSLIQSYARDIIINIIWYNIRTNGPKEINKKLLKKVFKNYQNTFLKIKIYVIIIINFMPAIFARIINRILYKFKKEKYNNVRID